MSGILWSGTVAFASLPEVNGIHLTSLSDWLLQEAFAFQRPQSWSSVPLEISYKALHLLVLFTGSHLDLGKYKTPSSQSC